MVNAGEVDIKVGISLTRQKYSVLQYKKGTYQVETNASVQTRRGWFLLRNG
jgi:hypothetical protein